MKKFLLVLFVLALHFRLYAQQFAQYNTGTLYDGFENPSQKTFIADSSRMVAFNFFLPNFNLTTTLSGDVQAALKRRAFLNKYDDNPLILGQNRQNYLRANFNNYAFMLKIYTNLDGNQEVGLFAQTKGEGRGVFSDETVQMLADNHAFDKTSYTDIFNTHFSYQIYHQIGVSYRGDVDNRLSFGVKVGALLGVVYNRVNINHSVVNFDRTNDRAFISMQGNYLASFEPGKFGSRDFLPTLKNPGASISFGSSYITTDKTHIQFNIKDLGFIHWNRSSLTGEFNNTGVVDSLTYPHIENRLTRTAASLVQSNPLAKGFNSPTNALMELSASKTYLLNNYSLLKYTPTLILSKELFYTGFTGAFVNHLQYHNYVGTFTASYDDMKYLGLGLQFMIKTPNSEFFIGTERVDKTAGLIFDATKNTADRVYTNSSYSGANFYLGVSFKIGRILEHPANASTIPMGDHRSFVKRLIQRFSKKED